MIYELLFYGEENAISGKEICKRLKIDGRRLTASIEAERRDGLPICATTRSDHPGYYLAPDQEAMIAYCRRLEHREAEIAKTRAACLDSVPSLPARGAL